jgi:ATP-dependent Clp protease ATP-binding subunit ClpC
MLVMFERFTDRARKIMALANRIAHHSGVRIIGDMEILLGLLEEGRGVGVEVLKRLDVNLQKTHDELIGKTSFWASFRQMKRFPQTAEAKRVIQSAITASASLGHNYVGSEHLLLAMTMNPTSAAGKALMARGVDEAKVRQEIEQILQAR